MEERYFAEKDPPLSKGGHKTTPEQGSPQKVESDLSPFTAEYQPKRTCSTQNKAKRANKIVFLLLVRDQEAGGSNPLAPTILSNSLSRPPGLLISRQ
jgi:hypothetical protein